MDSTAQLPLFDDEKKICTCCKEPQPLESFDLRPDRPGKYKAKCRPCEAEYHREYNDAHREHLRVLQRGWAKRHPEKIQAWGKCYRTEHAEKHEASKAKCKRERKAEYARTAKRWRAEHREQSNANAVKSYYRHQEERQRASAEWAKNHREYVARLARSIGHRRRARKRGNGGSFTPWDWECIKARYDWTCLRCGKREPDIKLHADHVVPLILGGFNIASNLAPLCHKCNAIKGSKFIDYRPDPYGLKKGT